MLAAGGALALGVVLGCWGEVGDGLEAATRTREVVVCLSFPGKSVSRKLLVELRPVQLIV